MIPTSSPPSRLGGRSRPATVAALRRAGARGFTIPELLAVIMIIGIFAAVASPMFIHLMRDRRVNRAAMEISGLYRLARSRALGRGNAVIVRWRETDFKFDVRETIFERYTSVIANNCSGVPDFLDPTTTQPVTEFTVGGGVYELAEVQFKDEAGADQSIADICFSPRGRSYIRYTDNGSFAVMTGVPRVEVKNSRTFLLRKVYIPPNGVARLAL